MRCVVTGSGGQLGRCLVRRLGDSRAHQLLHAPGHAECDLAVAEDIDRLLEAGPGEGAEVVFNAAAYTAVDRCEREEALAYATNAEGAERLARRCKEKGALLVHVSTDYVFDGTASEPYSEAEPTSPASAYGRTKLAGEEGVLSAAASHLVVRTSWVFGPGRNFVAAILEQARKRRSGELTGPLRVVDDQVGSPTYADHLSVGLVSLAERALGGAARTDAQPCEESDAKTPGGDAQRAGEPIEGLYHLTSAGHTSWWGFARRILDRTGHEDLEIDRMKTASLDLPAARPAYSVLDTSRAGALGVDLPPWEQGLDDYLASSEGQALVEARA